MVAVERAGKSPAFSRKKSSGQVLINALVLTGLANFRVVGKPDCRRYAQNILSLPRTPFSAN
jgi:hypothetical protein